MNRRDVLKMFAVGTAGYMASCPARRAHGAKEKRAAPEASMETYTWLIRFYRTSSYVLFLLIVLLLLALH